MRVILCLAVSFVLVFSVAIPKKRDTNCGAVTFPKGKRGNEATGVWCEICLTVAEIAKQYEECGEEWCEEQLDHYCESKFKDNTIPVCEKFVNGIFDQIIDDTIHQNTTRECDELLHDPNCHLA
ncbi:unnamed protein product, partial [Mesorhabditis spiculigera]